MPGAYVQLFKAILSTKTTLKSFIRNLCSDWKGKITFSRSLFRICAKAAPKRVQAQDQIWTCPIDAIAKEKKQFALEWLLE